MKQEKVKLTAMQKRVIKDLQGDFILITDSSGKGAWVGNSEGQYHINNGVFWRLVDKGLIWQDCSRYGHNNYVLTKLGKTIQL